jgi:hypothetical protein
LASATPRDEEELVREFAAVPYGWAAVGWLALLAVLLAAVVWMYRHEGRIGSTQRLRTALAGLRCAVLLALAAIWLEPVVVRYLHRMVDSYTIVLLDSSSSMDLVDGYRDEADAQVVNDALGVSDPPAIPRREIVERVLARDDNRFLRELADRNRVKMYTFSGEPELKSTIRASRERARGDGSAAGSPEALTQADGVDVSFAARGAVTNIERAVRRSVESLGSAPIAGVVIFSDGGINQGDGAEGVARYALERKVPLWVVGVGDPSPPRNVRISEVLAPETVLKQDPFSIVARIATQGVDGRTVQVVLRMRDADGSEEGAVVDSREVTIGEGGVVPPISFTRKPTTTGRFTYTVEVPVAEWESVVDDNVKQFTVNVVESRSRVLLVSGGPSWDYRFISRLLQRDETFELSCWLQSADERAVRDGNRVIDRLPATAEELFEYDAVILLDPDPSEFDEAWCRLVETLVTDYGGGLLLQTSRAHAPRLMAGESTAALVRLLPVSPDPDVELLLNQIGHYQTKPSTIIVPDAAHAHPVMQLSDDATTTRLAWRGMGDVYWHYPVLREKPAATVLMRHGDPRMQNGFGSHVLMAVQYAGAGRTAFLGFDATWRWRRFGEGVYDRFWVQLVRHLVEGKQFGANRRGTLLTEGEQFALGDAITVTARLFDRQYKPLAVDRVRGDAVVEGQRSELELSAKRDSPGWFEGRFVPDRVGSYRLRVALPSDEGSAGKSDEVTREIHVSRPNIEIHRPQMDRSALVRLASGSDGGRYFDINEVASLPALIPDVHEETTVKSRPNSLWDNGWVLALLVLLLGGEWALRKWFRML